MVQYRVEKGPAYSTLKVLLNPGESIVVEPGSYMLHRGEVQISTSSLGVSTGIARMLTGGESFFFNSFTARSPTEIWIAPSVPGDIAAIELNGELFIQDTSYLAHVGEVELSVGWRGLKGLIAEGELFWLKASGRGLVFVNSYGAIEEISLGPGERVTVDNGHFVAMDGTIQWRIRKLGGLKTFFFGGEGLVIETTGPGRIWIQTRTLPSFASVISKYLPKGKR
ncbi:MAG: TIGR00266 family protein [Candidatus Nezhaarchaeales archaeon]